MFQMSSPPPPFTFLEDDMALSIHSGSFDLSYDMVKALQDECMVTITTLSAIYTTEDNSDLNGDI